MSELTTAQKLRAVDDAKPWKIPLRELRLQAANELEALQKEVVEWKQHAAQSDKELCQLQDALGCPAESRNYSCDCGWRGYNQSKCPTCGKETFDDGMADAQELAMNRLRDLIATEGEAGDLRTQNQELQNRITELKAFCDDVEGLLQAERNQNQELREALLWWRHGICPKQLFENHPPTELNEEERKTMRINFTDKALAQP